MNKKILMLAATLIAGATSLGVQAQTAGEGPEAGRQRPAPSSPNMAVPPTPQTMPGGGAMPSMPGGAPMPGGLTSGLPQTQGGTMPNSHNVPPGLPPGLVPAPGRDAAPQLSTGGGTQLQQPGQTTTR